MLINAKDRNAAPVMTFALWLTSELETSSFSNNAPTMRKSNAKKRGRTPSNDLRFLSRGDPQILSSIGSDVNLHI
jgi:hypothetical protein